MIYDKHITVSETQAGMRLDRFLTALFPTTSRSLVLKALRNGSIHLGGRSAAKGAKLVPGDSLHVLELMEAQDIRVLPDPSLPLEVIHEDAALLAFNKPAGMPVHPLDPDETGTLAQAALARYPDLQGVGDHPLMPGILHRIDTDTSGLVLAARNQETFDAVRSQFRRHTISKLYLALACGSVSASARLENDLVHEPAARGHMRVADHRGAPDGQRLLHAVTSYVPLAVGNEMTLLQVEIFTGVTHQIRCQLAHAGLPILGDRVYGNPEHPGAVRHMLHSWKMTLLHPGTGAALTIHAPLPEDFRTALQEAGIAGTEERAEG